MFVTIVPISFSGWQDVKLRETLSKSFFPVIKVAGVCLRKTFLETMCHRWEPKKDLNIGEFPGCGGFDETGQIYNHDVL